MGAATDPVRNARLAQGRRLLGAAEHLLAVPPASTSEMHARWWALFGDDAETVQRAANNLLYAKPISDSNLVAAADIGERLLDTVKRARGASDVA